MSSYQGLTVQEIFQFVLAKCKKAGWDVNYKTVVKFLNMALMEFEMQSKLTLSYWETATIADSAEYQLPEDMGILIDVFIKETGTEGGIPLKPASFKQYQASVADDDLTDEVVEP